MPILRYVDTASTAGGDGTTNATTGANRAYATLDAALLEWEGTTLTDVVEIICAASTGVADTAVVAQGSTITTSSTNYVLIRAATGHDALLTGWSTGRYRLSPANANALTLNGVNHCVVQGLQIEASPTGASNTRIAVSMGNVAGTAKFLTIDRCRIRVNAAGTGTGHIGVNYQNASGRLRVVNSVLEAVGTNTANVSLASVRQDVANTSVIYSTTFYGANVGVSYNSATGGTNLKVVNCLTNCTDGFSTSTFRTGSNYNASSAASDAPGANSRNSQTFTFENAGAGDYRLASNDAGARTFGTDLSADSDYAFNIDMAGTTRTVPWDIGAHQVSFTPTSIPVRPYYFL
jgi:hypothetical protein